MPVYSQTRVDYTRCTSLGGREGIKGNIFRMVRGFVITEIIEFLENECVCQGGVIHRK